MRYYLFLVFFLFQIIAHAQELSFKVDYYELENGLKVYLNEDSTASNVYGAVWVNAGGKDDPADATGIAHYLEHMLFKGTTELGTQNYALEKPHLDSIKVLYDQLALTQDATEKKQIQSLINQQELKASAYAIPNEFDKLVKSLGSTGVNASTSNDYTNYYNYFPANQMEKWLDIYAHRFKEPVFRLFQSELEAVYEEKNRASDDLQRRILTKFNEYIYGDHPYSTQTVLGEVEHLKNPSLTKMYEYFKTYYVPNNMALVLCGNFDASSVKPLIEQTFGTLERGEEAVFPSYDRNAFEGRVVEKVRVTPVKVGFMGYKLVPATHPDRPALTVVSGMMSNSNETGYIDKMNLNNEVLYAGADYDFMEEDGANFIFFVPKIFGKSLKKHEEIIKGFYQQIAAGDFSDAFFESVKNNIYRNYNLSVENLGARGRALGLSFIYDTDYQEYMAFPDKVAALTKQEVQQAAQQYFGDNYFTLQSRTGFPKKVKLDKPNFKPISARTEAVSEYAEAFQKIQEEPIKPQFIDLNSDLSISEDYFFYTENKINDIFTLRLLIPGGEEKDPLYEQLAQAFNATGTEGLSASELKNKFAQLGATYYFGADRTTFTITVTGLDQNFEATISLLGELLNDFSPDGKTITSLYNQRKTANKLDLNDPATGGRILYSYGLFGERSTYKTRLPASQLKQLKPATLKAKREELLANGFTSIHYIGSKEEAAIKDFILSKKLFKKNTVDTYTFNEAKEVNETTFYIVDDKKSIQSYVYYIVNGRPLDPQKDAAKEAFNAYYTNGLSGLLFQEVREFRSLAYATGGNYIDPLYEPTKKGRLVLFTGSQSDKTTDAVEVVMGLINDMPVYPSRFASIKEGLILEAASNKADFRDLSLAAESFIRTGYKQDPAALNFEQFPGLTFEQVIAFYEENIKGKAVSVTIYGDASKFDMDKLKTYGKVVELDLKDIVVE